MAQGPTENEDPIAVIEGPCGTAKIVESYSDALQAFEYQVKFNSETQTFNTLGEAYLVAGELAGAPE